MRIAHVVPRGEIPSSGVLTVIVELAGALSRRGHDVRVYQQHRWSSERYSEQCSRMQAAGVTVVPPSRDASVTRLGRLVATSIEDGGADVVHLHGAFNPSNAVIARHLRPPFVYSPHSGYDPVSLSRSHLRKAVYRVLFERPTLRRAAIIAALTDAERTQVREFGATRPCFVVPNGVSMPPDDVDPEAFRRDVGLSREVPLALFVGRLDVFRKGLDILLRGIAEAPDWHVALVGPPFRDVRRLDEMIDELRITQRVHLTGERGGSRLHEAFVAADIFTLVSRWEGLPMALLEALAFGKPAVVSPAVDRSIGIAANGAGWVVEADGLGSLFRSLADVRDARHELDVRGQAARRVTRRYRWESIAERFEEVYAEAAHSKTVAST